MNLTTELAGLRRALATYGRANAAPSEALCEALAAVAAGHPPPDDGWLRVLGGRRRSRLSMREAAASLLTQLGVWDGHEDIEALASGLLMSPPPLARPWRMHTEPELDATDVPLVAIDSADPHEIDDALYAEREGESIRLWIAIAAPGCWIAPGDPIDLDARSRGASLYHPRYHVPMLDAAFCRDACSLVPAQRRPALLLRLRIDAAGDAVTEAVDLAWVRVAESWTYDDAGRALDDGSAPPWLAAAAEAAQRSETARIARGAYLLYRPDVELRAPPFATPTLRPAPQAALARRVVSEAMVRAGIAVAGWLDVRGLPAPFRGHTAVRPPPLPPGCYTDPADVGAVLRSMGPARVQARSLRHDILGAAAYVQAGSPLRRYGDLLVQHQVLAAMRQRPTPFDAGPLLEALSASEERRRAMRRLERRGRRYFQLLHLAGHGLGTTLRGQVLAGNGRLPPRAQVPELGLEIELPSYAGGEGEWVRLVVDAIDPMRGRIDVHIAG